MGKHQPRTTRRQAPSAPRQSHANPHRLRTGAPLSAPTDAAVDALLQQALALHQQAQWRPAKLAYLTVLERVPAHFEAQRLLGILHFQQGEYADAISRLQHALRIDASQPNLHLTLGNAQQALGQNEAALASYDNALQLQPAYVEAHYNRALTLQMLQRLDSALTAYDSVLRLQPDHLDAHCNRGATLAGLQRTEEALAGYQRALQLDPDHLQARHNLGHALHSLNRPAQALPHYDRVLQLKPDYVEALCNYGLALQALNQLDSALACYTRAAQLQPELAIAHWNQGLCHLLQGDFAAGWPKYEWGWASGQRGPRRDFVAPLWLGDQPLQGKHILLHAEQGLGDTLQFCRYVPLVVALGAHVWLEVPAPLQALLGQLPGVTGVLAQGEPLPPCDYHCPLLSLPLACGTRLDTIPAQPAYLRADPAKTAAWAAQLEAQLPRPRRPRIGIAWSGNPAHRHDALRSIPLAQLAPLFFGQADFISVQTDLRAADRESLQHFKVLDPSPALHDFSDTAALLAGLDRVITVDTSVAHLAGALGIPTTLLLPYAPDFRWLLERDDSPWYPSLRLVRQTTPGVWDDVIERVAHDLREQEYGR